MGGAGASASGCRHCTPCDAPVHTQPTSSRHLVRNPNNHLCKTCTKGLYAPPLALRSKGQRPTQGTAVLSLSSVLRGLCACLHLCGSKVPRASVRAVEQRWLWENRLSNEGINTGVWATSDSHGLAGYSFRLINHLHGCDIKHGKPLIVFRGPPPAPSQETAWLLDDELTSSNGQALPLFDDGTQIRLLAMYHTFCPMLASCDGNKRRRSESPRTISRALPPPRPPPPPRALPLFPSRRRLSPHCRAQRRPSMGPRGSFGDSPSCS